MTDSVLAPLRERYAHWLTMDEEQVQVDRDEAAEDVRALQLILRLERAEPPSWHVAVALAATGATAICLDDRAAPGGPWHDAVRAYVTGHIRKVTRRARGAQWAATVDLPGRTLTDGNRTEIRALVPGRTVDLDARVSRLQVGGTDVAVDEPPPPPTGLHLEVLVPTEPTTTLGKTMAQSGHAGMIAAALAERDRPDTLATWRSLGFPVAARRLAPAAWSALTGTLADPDAAWVEHGLLAVRDAGFTEVDPGTVTVLARFA